MGRGPNWKYTLCMSSLSSGSMKIWDSGAYMGRHYIQKVSRVLESTYINTDTLTDKTFSVYEQAIKAG